MPMETVTMAFPKQRSSRVQQSLFQPPVAPPQWRLLPEAVRQEAVKLLTRLVHEHMHRKTARAAGEVSDD